MASLMQQQAETLNAKAGADAQASAERAIDDPIGKEADEAVSSKDPKKMEAAFQRMLGAIAKLGT